MNRTEIAAELRTLSKGGLISAREVGIFVRDSNVSRVRNRYLQGLESCRGRYMVSDVAKRLQKEFK